jgi:iron complex transport system substrate-binding protein
MKLSYKIAAIIIVILVVSTAGFVTYGNMLNNKPQSPEKTEMTVTDMQNRTVTLKVPADRIVLTESSHTPALAAILGDSFADKIVGWDTDFKDNAGDGYAKFVDKFPKLADIPDVGDHDFGTVSVEKVISLNPDVVILHSWQYMFAEDATKEAVSKLEQAGIPVVFLDFYMDPMGHSTQSMLLLGKILGNEARAQEIVDFYNEQTNLVYSRLANITGTKPTVYLEVGSKTPPDYGMSYGDVAWGAIIKKAGGDNIAEATLGTSAKALSPEYVISQNPDIVVFTARNWSTPGSLKLGYATTAETARSAMSGYVDRPGWNTLNAVKDHKVYGIYHGYCFSIYNFAVLQSFAKWFYPEQFSDLDVNAVLQQYHEQFLPVDFSGIFVFSYY